MPIPVANQPIPTPLLEALFRLAFPSARKGDKPTASIRWFRYLARLTEPIDPASPDLMTWYVNGLDPSKRHNATPRQLSSRMSTEVENLRKRLAGIEVPPGSGQFITVQKGHWQFVRESALPERKPPTVARPGLGRRISPRVLFQPFLNLPQEVWFVVPSTASGDVALGYLQLLAMLGNRWAADGLRFEPRLSPAGVPVVLPERNCLIACGSRAANPYVDLLATVWDLEPPATGETRFTRGKLPGGAWAMMFETSRPADALALLSQVLLGVAGWRAQGGCLSASTAPLRSADAG